MVEFIYVPSRLHHYTSGLTIEIKDDGCGFERDHVVPRPGHLGLVGMRERALAVGAVVSVQSLPGVGSCVRFEWLDVSVQNMHNVPSVPSAETAARPPDLSPAVSVLAVDRAKLTANEGRS